MAGGTEPTAAPLSIRLSSKWVNNPRDSELPNITKVWRIKNRKISWFRSRYSGSGLGFHRDGSPRDLTDATVEVVPRRPGRTF
jgi:hypothetical protein